MKFVSQTRFWYANYIRVDVFFKKQFFPLFAVFGRPKNSGCSARNITCHRSIKLNSTNCCWISTLTCLAPSTTNAWSIKSIQTPPRCTKTRWSPRNSSSTCSPASSWVTNDSCVVSVRANHCCSCVDRTNWICRTHRQKSTCPGDPITLRF